METKSVTLYDISIPLSPDVAGWPGDAEYRLERVCSIADGSSVNLSTIHMSAHFGTHADAPIHYSDAGVGVEELDLNLFIGPAALIDVSEMDNILPEHLPKDLIARSPRLLMRTGAWTDVSKFPDSLPTLTVESVEHISACGVRLIGLDVPSVDELDSKELPIHHALGKAGISIIESLRLDGIPEGIYELIALPVSLRGSDGSPVRAILRTIPK